MCAICHQGAQRGWRVLTAWQATTLTCRRCCLRPKNPTPGTLRKHRRLAGLPEGGPAHRTDQPAASQGATWGKTKQPVTSSQTGGHPYFLCRRTARPPGASPTATPCADSGGRQTGTPQQHSRMPGSTGPRGSRPHRPNRGYLAAMAQAASAQSPEHRRPAWGASQGHGSSRDSLIKGPHLRAPARSGHLRAARDGGVHRPAGQGGRRHARPTTRHAIQRRAVVRSLDAPDPHGFGDGPRRLMSRLWRHPRNEFGVFAQSCRPADSGMPSSRPDTGDTDADRPGRGTVRHYRRSDARHVLLFDVDRRQRRVRSLGSGIRSADRRRS